MNASRLHVGAAAVLAGLLVSGCGRTTPEGALSDDKGKPFSAEQLYDRMDEKLSNSRTFQFTFDATVRQKGKNDAGLKGSAAFAVNNKMRLELLDAPKEFGPKSTIVSDGTKLLLLESEKPPRPAPKSEVKTAGLLSMFSRFGAALGWFTPTDIHLGDLKPQAFKLGPKEKLDGRTAQVIEYDLNIDWKPPEGEALPPAIYHVKLWIDGETGLPRKREVTDDAGGIFESYHDMKVDESLDPKVFDTTK